VITTHGRLAEILAEDVKFSCAGGYSIVISSLPKYSCDVDFAEDSVVKYEVIQSRFCKDISMLAL
jgi:hypothetical protein